MVTHSDIKSPSPGREERKLVKVIGDKTYVVQFKMNSGIYIAGNQSQTNMSPDMTKPTK